MIKKVELDFHGRPLSIEVGRLAKQADGAALVQYGETVVLVTAVAAKELKMEADFWGGVHRPRLPVCFTTWTRYGRNFTTKKERKREAERSKWESLNNRNKVWSNSSGFIRRTPALLKCK